MPVRQYLPTRGRSTDAAAPGVHGGQPRAEIGHLAVDGHGRTELADHEGRALAAAATTQRAGPMQVIPLRLVFAVAVEHLHAVVLAVGDVDPAVGVGDDIMHAVELAGAGAGLTPALAQLAVRRERAHAGVAVP